MSSMWYIKLLEYCAKKINKSERDQAVLFIHDLIDLFKNKFSPTEDLELMLVFGFVIDIYKFVNLKRKKPLSLTEFAEQSIGLLMLHTKNSEDEAWFCSDFIDLLTDEKIYSAFKIDSELIKYRKQYLMGERQSKYVIPLSNLHTLKKYKINNDYLRLVILTDVLKRIETKVFYNLGYIVKTSLDEMVLVLNFLLNKIDDQFNILIDLHKYLLPYKNDDLKFNQFIAAVDRELRKFKVLRFTPGNFINIGKLTKFLHSSYTLLDAYEEEKPDNKSHPSKKLKNKVHVKLLLIPLLSLEHLARYNPEMIAIGDQLEKYTSKSQGFLSFFGKKLVREHTKEIAAIANDIRRGEFVSVRAIIDELNSIQITNPADELIQIIDFIERNNIYKMLSIDSSSEHDSFNYSN